MLDTNSNVISHDTQRVPLCIMQKVSGFSGNLMSDQRLEKSSILYYKWLS